MGNSTKSPICDETCVSTTKVQGVIKKLKAERDLFELAEKFKVLGNETRLRIIFSLSSGELCVCEIAEVLDLSIPATSQQLKILRQQGLIGFRIEGKIVYYFLIEPDLPRLLREAAQRIFSY